MLSFSFRLSPRFHPLLPTLRSLCGPSVTSVLSLFLSSLFVSSLFFPRLRLHPLLPTLRSLCGTSATSVLSLFFPSSPKSNPPASVLYFLI
jgi:hypothetical protein